MVFYIKASEVFSLLLPVGLGGDLTPIMQMLVGTCPRSRIYSALAVMTPCIVLLGLLCRTSDRALSGEPGWSAKLDMT